MDKELVSLFKSFSEGDAKAVFISPVSDERLTFNSHFEQGKEFIDCSCDGEYEYYIHLQYHKEGHYPSAPRAYNLYMILKNIDGKLSISFAYEYLKPDEGFRDYIDIYNNGQMKIAILNNGRYKKYNYFLAADNSLNYLYTEGSEITAAEDLLHTDIGTRTSFTMIHTDGSEITMNGRGCEIEYFEVKNGDSPYIYKIDIYDKDSKIHPEDSDEYQAVKKFYEDEGYVILTYEEGTELMNSIKEKAGLTDDMKGNPLD